MDYSAVFTDTIQIISAVGSLATFGAFLFLFKRDVSKQEQIDKLAAIASALKLQFEQDKENTRLMFLPLIQLFGYQFWNNSKKFNLTIRNVGKPAVIRLLRTVSDSVVREEGKYVAPYDLNTLNENEFTFTLANGFDQENAQIVFDIVFSDQIGNTYKSTFISGKGISRLTEMKLLTSIEKKSYNLI